MYDTRHTHIFRPCVVDALLMSLTSVILHESCTMMQPTSEILSGITSLETCLEILFRVKQNFGKDLL